MGACMTLDLPATQKVSNHRCKKGVKLTDRTRRQKNWWEPIFDPDIEPITEKGSWDFKHNGNPRLQVFEDSGKTEIANNITFEKVDFSGEFKNRIIFVDCKFHFCDFGLSTFLRAKFTNCEFKNTTFAMCTLEDCELRDCTFENISFSGNETILDRTLITNPSQFIKGARAYLGGIPEGKSKAYQRLKMYETKSTISRRLLSALSDEGSEQSFYDGLKTSTISDNKARMAIAAIDIINTLRSPRDRFPRSILKIIWSLFKITASLFDLLILWTFGLLNAWGKSLSRPIIFGGVGVFIFSVVYDGALGIPTTSSIIKSLEIWLLFGYTKYAAVSNLFSTEKIQLANAAAGLVWYAVTIPTIVNKLTRVRT